MDFLATSTVSNLTSLWHCDLTPCHCSCVHPRLKSGTGLWLVSCWFCGSTTKRSFVMPTTWPPMMRCAHHYIQHSSLTVMNIRLFIVNVRYQHSHRHAFMSRSSTWSNYVADNLTIDSECTHYIHCKTRTLISTLRTYNCWQLDHRLWGALVNLTCMMNITQHI